MGELSNPARRLHDLLTELQSAWRTNTNKNRPGYEVLRQIGSGGRTEPQFFQWLGSAMALPAEVIDTIERVRLPAVSYASKPLREIADGFSGPLVLMGIGSNGWLNQVNLMALSAVAESMDQSPSITERRLPDSVVADMKARIDGIIEVVLDSDLPDELREFLIETLTDVRNALVRYRLTGVAGLARTLDTAVGRWRRTAVPDLDESNSKLKKRALAALATLAALVQFGTNVKTLTEHDPALPWHGCVPIEEVIKMLPATEPPAIEAPKSPPALTAGTSDDD